MSRLFEPLESALRRVMEFDPETRARIEALEGRTVEVGFTGMERSMSVRIEAGALRFSSGPATRPDLRLSGSPAAFGRYMLAPERVDITESGIKIEGDIGLAQRFVGVLRELDVDWEEWASRYVGDVAAYHAGRMLGELRDWGRDSARQLQQDVTEYLQEESRLLAPRERVRRLMDGIDATRSDVERLAQRVKRLRDNL